MGLIFITALLMLSLIIRIITAEDVQKYLYKNSSNATFLPYTLKAKENMNVKSDSLPDLIELNDKSNKYEVLVNKEFKYEKNNENHLEPETSNWKRFTSTYLSPYPFEKQHGGYNGQNEFLCKTHTKLYGQQLSSTALIGSSNFMLAQTLFSIINLVVLSYMLLSIVTLLNRLLSYGSMPIVPTNNEFGGSFYKNNK